VKMPEDIRFVAVEGVIGVGKTSLVRILQERLDCGVLFEEFEENPFLERFYQDKKAWAFQTQMFFLLSRHRQFQETFQQRDLFFDVTISDYTFDKDKIFAIQNLSEDELSMYDTVATALERDRVKPDYIIYLRAGVDKLVQRIRKRGRSMEKGMDPAYLAELLENYDRHFFHYSDCPVLIVNTDEIDFVERSQDLEDLLNQIEKVPAGTMVYTPESLL